MDKEIIMNCHNCKKDLSKEENKLITIESLVFSLTMCKECWDNKIIGRCHTCEWPVYKNDLVYEISINRGAEYFINASEETKKIQCKPCYYDWLEKQKKKRWIRWGLLTILILLAIWSLFIVLPIFYPKLKENWQQTSLFDRCILIILLFVIPITTIYLMVQEFSSRYKIRERKGK